MNCPDDNADMKYQGGEYWFCPRCRSLFREEKSGLRKVKSIEQECAK